tara:strand:- start:1179 stop:1352 length:174 start_codon:yes stop_codon:yes gene_type:complete
MHEVKDSIANIATIGSISVSMMSVQSVLTIGLLATALYLNIQRIMANRKKAEEQDSE